MSGTTVIGVSVSCADDSLAAEVHYLLRATDVPTSGEHSMVVDTRFVGAGYGSGRGQSTDARGHRDVRSARRRRGRCGRG